MHFGFDPKTLFSLMTCSIVGSVGKERGPGGHCSVLALHPAHCNLLFTVYKASWQRNLTEWINGKEEGLALIFLSFFFSQTFNFEIVRFTCICKTYYWESLFLFPPNGNILEILVEHHNQDMDRDMVKIQNISLLKCTTWDFIFLRVWWGQQISRTLPLEGEFILTV